MLERRTIIDQIEIKRDGTVQVRLMKAIVEGEAIVAHDYHRFALEPGGDLDATTAAVNAHLGSMGEAAVEAGELDRVRSIVALEHTPERVAAFREKRGVSLRLPNDEHIVP